MIEEFLTGEGLPMTLSGLAAGGGAYLLRGIGADLRDSVRRGHKRMGGTPYDALPGVEDDDDLDEVLS